MKTLKPAQQSVNSVDLHYGVADSTSLFAEHLIFQRLVYDDVGNLLQVHRTWI